MSFRSRIALVAAALVLAAVAVSTLLQTLVARSAILEQTRTGGDRIAGMLARVAAFAEDLTPPEAPEGARQKALEPGFVWEK